MSGGICNVTTNLGHFNRFNRVFASGFSFQGKWVSMGVCSDGGHYGIPEGLIYSFPVKIVNKTWTVVEGLEINDFSRSKMDISAKELLEERETAVSFLSSQ